MQGKKILVTGGTGQVGRPIVQGLAARGNEVWCAARFTSDKVKAKVEDMGARTFRWELGSDDFAGLPDDFDYVVHSAWNYGQNDSGDDYEAAIVSNVEGTALLMEHCRKASAFLFISSLIVYRWRGGRAVYREREEGYGNSFARMPTYSPSKVAGEGLVRGLARVLDLPVTIARLGSAYGAAAHGGGPVHIFRRLLAGETIYRRDEPQLLSLIHEDDIVAQVEPLLKAASVPATIVNWVGDEIVDEDELYAYLAGLAGVEPKFEQDLDLATTFFAADPEYRKTLTGPTSVSWKEGVRKVLAKRFPETVREPA